MYRHWVLAACFFVIGVLPAEVEASRFVFGAAGGAEFPFAQDDQTDWGIRAEAFYRVDPYEIRFSYSELNVDYYSVVLGRKFFFTQDLLRPFFEAGGGMVIAYTENEGTAFGVSPVLSLGAELGIHSFLSAVVATRYSAYWYFGSTSSGSMEANHSLSLIGGVNLWF